MKKIILYSSLFSVLLVTSCNEGIVDNINNGNEDTHKYTIVAKIEESNTSRSTRTIQSDDWDVSSLSNTINTRVVVDQLDGKTKWINGDKVHLISSTDLTTLKEFTATQISDNGKTATFTTDIGLANTKQMMYGIYPATGSGAKWGDVGYMYKLPSIATQNNSLDAVSMLAYPTEIDFSLPEISAQIGFTHLYAALGIQLQMPVGTSGTVKSVIIRDPSSSGSSGSYIASREPQSLLLTIEENDVDFGKFIYFENLADITITMPESGLIVGEGEVFDIYAMIFPVNLSGKKMIIDVILDDDTYFSGTKSGTDFHRGIYYKWNDDIPPTQLLAWEWQSTDERICDFSRNSVSSQPATSFQSLDSALALYLKRYGNI